MIAAHIRLPQRGRRAAQSPYGHARTIASVSPYLAYFDADAAAEWLQEVLGFGPVRVSRDADGRWFEGELRAGSSTLHITQSTADDDPAARGVLIVHVGDVDAQYRRMCVAGAEPSAPEDKPYGPRVCDITDPWGTHWYFWQGDAVYT